MTPDRLYAEYDEEIDRLRSEMIYAEDHCQIPRAEGLRHRILQLEWERDLLPTQRKP